MKPKAPFFRVIMLLVIFSAQNLWARDPQDTRESSRARAARNARPMRVVTCQSLLNPEEAYGLRDRDHQPNDLVDGLPSSVKFDEARKSTFKNLPSPPRETRSQFGEFESPTEQFDGARDGQFN